MASLSDMEKGLAGRDLASAEESRTDSSANPNPTEQGTAKSDELRVFQKLVGIHFLGEDGVHLSYHDVKTHMTQPASPLKDIFMPSAIRESQFRNRGLYDRALSQELKNRSLYTMSHYIISGLYLLQILLAATFTALSAYQSVSSVPLTVLGAMNTIIAGILAWLRGQGMPVRFRAARDLYRELVKDIEATERMFSEIAFTDWPEGRRPNPILERNRLEQRYTEALTDQQANYPEAHNTPTSDKKTEQSKTMQQKIQEDKVTNEKLKKIINDTYTDMVGDAARKAGARKAAAVKDAAQSVLGVDVLETREDEEDEEAVEAAEEVETAEAVEAFETGEDDTEHVAEKSDDNSRRTVYTTFTSSTPVMSESALQSAEAGPEIVTISPISMSTTPKVVKIASSSQSERLHEARKLAARKRAQARSRPGPSSSEYEDEDSALARLIERRKQAGL